MDFKEKYVRAETWGDLEKAVDETLTPTEIKNLAESLETTKTHTGLDMRQDFLLGLLKSTIKYKLGGTS